MTEAQMDALTELINIGYARAAAELMPADAQGWFLVGASLGLQAQYESTRRQVRMAGEMLSISSVSSTIPSAMRGSRLFSAAVDRMIDRIYD